MKNITHYSKPGPQGSTIIDIESMVVDLITVCKMGGIDGPSLHEFINETWPKVKIEITIPKEAKN